MALPSPPPFAQPPPVAVRAELSPQVEAAIQALRTQGQRLAEQARSDALEIGLLVARKILERELVTGLEPLFSLIRSAVRRVGDANKTIVKLCPADVNRVQEANGLDFSIGRVELVADPALTSGDVMVETEHHRVDGRIETRLEEIRRELLGTLEA
jgi:flagellar assembly protein FliH